MTNPSNPGGYTLSVAAQYFWFATVSEAEQYALKHFPGRGMSVNVCETERAPLKRVCAVCQQVPCFCPDLADECDEEAAEEEAAYVSGLLRGDFDAALAVQVVDRA